MPAAKSSSKVEGVNEDMRNLHLSDVDMKAEEMPALDSDSEDDEYIDSDQAATDEEGSDLDDMDDTEEDSPIKKIIVDITSDRKAKADLIHAAAAGFEPTDSDDIVYGAEVFRNIVQSVRAHIPNPSAEQIVAFLAQYGDNILDEKRNFAWFDKNALAEDYMEIAKATTSIDDLNAAIKSEDIGNVWVDGAEGRVSVVKLARALKARLADSHMHGVVDA